MKHPEFPSVFSLSGEVAVITGDVPLGADLIAGTAWLFARPEFEQRVDYIFAHSIDPKRIRSAWDRCPSSY